MSNLMRWVLDHSQITEPELRLLLVVLASYGNDDGTSIRPTILSIARRMRKTERHVRKLLARLYETHEAEQVERIAGGRGLSNQWRIPKEEILKKPCHSGQGFRGRHGARNPVTGRYKTLSSAGQFGGSHQLYDPLTRTHLHIRPALDAPAAAPGAPVCVGLGSVKDSVKGEPESSAALPANIAQPKKSPAPATGAEDPPAATVDEAQQLRPAAKAVRVNRPAAGYSFDFEEAWGKYPARSGGNSKSEAYGAWKARLRQGVEPRDLILGVERYGDFVKLSDIWGTQFVKQASTFFGPGEHWREEWSYAAPQRTLFGGENGRRGSGPAGAGNHHPQAGGARGARYRHKDAAGGAVDWDEEKRRTGGAVDVGGATRAADGPDKKPD